MLSRSNILLCLVLLLHSCVVFGQLSLNIKPVVGIKIFNPWADASLVYPIYKGTVSISPTYGLEKTFDNSHWGIELRQSHFVAIAPKPIWGSNITVYRRITCLGAFYQWKNGLRFGIDLASHFVSDAETSLGIKSNWDWGVCNVLSFPFSGLSVELRHEPLLYSRFILEGDKYSISLTYKFKNTNKGDTADAKHQENLSILLGSRIGLNRHYGNSRDDYGFQCVQGEWGLRYIIPKTNIAVDIRNSFWFSFSGGLNNYAVNGKSNLISAGLFYQIDERGKLGVGIEHFWLTDYTYNLVFIYNKVDFYPERGIGLYASLKITDHFSLELRDQYAYHINAQLKNKVKPTDAYRVSVGLYYLFQP